MIILAGLLLFFVWIFYLAAASVWIVLVGIGRAIGWIWRGLTR